MIFTAEATCVIGVLRIPQLRRRSKSAAASTQATIAVVINHQVNAHAIIDIHRDARVDGRASRANPFGIIAKEHGPGYSGRTRGREKLHTERGEQDRLATEDNPLSGPTKHSVRTR